jgi:hypothetical protein
MVDAFSYAGKIGEAIGDASQAVNEAVTQLRFTRSGDRAHRALANEAGHWSASSAGPAADNRQLGRRKSNQTRATTLSCCAALVYEFFVHASTWAESHVRVWPTRMFVAQRYLLFSTAVLGGRAPRHAEL